MKKQVRLFHLLFLSIWINFVIVLDVVATVPISIRNNIPSLAPVLEKVLPAVVSIYVEGDTLEQQKIDFSETLKNFDKQEPQDRLQPFEGLGSGIIIDANKGYVLTNNHVISGAQKIYVKLIDNREYNAKLIGCDKNTDIALIKINGAKNLTQVKIANLDITKVGDFVIAVGNPFGLGQTATAGIISALGRNGLNIQGLENFIQTDAAINKGSSGGALVNLSGELIGINTAILASNSGSVGIGFAIPSDIALTLAQQLIKYGKIQQARLGIKGTEISIDMAHIFDLKGQNGVFISEVIPNSAAQRSGIKAGDVVMLMNNKPVNSFNELRVRIGITVPGKNIKLILLRDGKIFSMDVNIEKDIVAPVDEKIVFPMLPGVILENSETKKGDQGILIKNIEQGIVSDTLGLRKNDIIISVNRKRTFTIEDMHKVITSDPSMLTLNIIRNNESIYLLLK
ncbi:Do family serine endopeptidase [Pantoea sp. SoEX]|uniref:Do family serine endopeptidase n=1 Tax=Pantoea sp. SoEX TaxID=2576763 RepID=UPI001356B441|nr:Do family serine endopeptidase [Pantoea sp. SoEX]MXP51080.1 Do family serine endopeptidase [Pantoea sp. SoEX]